MGAEQDEVGHVAFTQETAVFDAEDARRVVAHEFDQALDGQHPLIDQVEHRDEGKLHKGHPARGAGRTTGFLAEEMGRVVGADATDAPIGEGGT